MFETAFLFILIERKQQQRIKILIAEMLGVCAVCRKATSTK